MKHTRCRYPEAAPQATRIRPRARLRTRRCPPPERSCGHGSRPRLIVTTPLPADSPPASGNCSHASQSRFPRMPLRPTGRLQSLCQHSTVFVRGRRAKDNAREKTSTRLVSRLSVLEVYAIIRRETKSRNSYGKRAQCAVMKSTVSTARSATTQRRRASAEARIRNGRIKHDSRD